ncbi:MAG: Hsp70 family protein, partial [Bdellovibrionales bacterium]|nr:Hsp70 family protein [Bdellovibrionales bacterium]
MSSRTIGIDLGTTNSSVAAYSTDTGEGGSLDIPQLVKPGTVEDTAVLPSALYLPHPDEFDRSACYVPGQRLDEQPFAIVGTFAREHGALSPHRLITSAKSWLCYRGVDPLAPILPWIDEPLEERLSPVDVTRRYLEHLRRAVSDDPQSQTWVVTVPASFDEVARELTARAAQDAGIPGPVLLEEPLAALYGWLKDHHSNWRDHISAGDVILIADVGGGTSDFTLVAACEKSGNLELERISVGEHLLLGGDNMDLALAHVLKHQLELDGPEIDEWEFLALVHAARTAKETLCRNESLEEVVVPLANRGANLFATSRSTVLSRATIDAVLRDGFFPTVHVTDEPKRQQSGLRTMGLPFESEPALTRHIALFLRKSLANVRSDERLSSLVPPDRIQETHIQPTCILFNGGVFGARMLRERVQQTVSSWAPDTPVRILPDADLDRGVSKGAAYYGALRATGRGVRIRSGTNRSFYVGIEAAMPAVPGLPPLVHGLCVVPQNTEEGVELDLAGEQYALLTGQPVQFRLFSSTTRAGDRQGTVVKNALRELDEAGQLELTVPTGGADAEMVPVRLRPRTTELGTLELWLEHATSDARWKLEFNLRAGAPSNSR